jgi:hypothetical protein
MLLIQGHTMISPCTDLLRNNELREFFLQKNTKEGKEEKFNTQMYLHPRH